MKPFHISLPATSANLGPGFDAIALALELYLEIDAELADRYSIDATGRNPDQCNSLRRNLLLSVYEETLRANSKDPAPLHITMRNGIPIGMGCGSSAAARLAGLALANHFGDLDWTGNRLLQEACQLEGHPDNAAACWLGGFTVAAGEGHAMRALSINPPPGWTAILVLPNHPLSTTTARAILPASYPLSDAVTNIQNAALLMAAFHTGNADALRVAMGDTLHQPYRGEVCPLLPALLPLAGSSGIMGVALSGAGPSVLALVADPGDAPEAISAIRAQLTGVGTIETLAVPLAPTHPTRAS
jgi:homoserine kinase